MKRTSGWSTTCPTCGKHTFHSRADAKAHARRAHPGSRLAVYRCGDGYHYGHLPVDLRQGKVSREYLYG